MDSKYKYYRYQGFFYRIEYGLAGNPIGCHMLAPDGWLPVSSGWKTITDDNTPITGDEAFQMARIKKYRSSI
jgi:hypothetical protein